MTVELAKRWFHTDIWSRYGVRRPHAIYERAAFLVAGAELFIRWRAGILDLPRVVLEVEIAHEFSVALRASCALVPRTRLASCVRPRIENSLAALRAAEVYLHSHPQEGEGTPIVRSPRLAMRRTPRPARTCRSGGSSRSVRARSVREAAA